MFGPQHGRVIGPLDPTDIHFPNRGRFGQPGYGVDTLASRLDVVLDETDPILFAETPLGLHLGLQGLADLDDETLLLRGWAPKVPKPGPIAFLELGCDLHKQPLQGSTKPGVPFWQNGLAPSSDGVRVPVHGFGFQQPAPHKP